MARQDEGRKLTLRYVFRLIWVGPFLAFLCGFALLGSPFQSATVGLLAFCTIYLVAGLVMWRRLRRMAVVHAIGVASFAIPSIFTALGVFRLGQGGSLDMILLLSGGYVASWVFGVLWVVKRGLRVYLDSYYGKREVDLERGLIDLTNRARIAVSFARKEGRKGMETYLSPQEQHWFSKWGWLIALLLIIVPLWRALNILYIDRMSPVAQNAYGIMIYYVLAALAAFVAGANLAWVFIWRRWERENGKPMLIKYLS